MPVAVRNDIEHRLDVGVIEGVGGAGDPGGRDSEEYGGAGLDFVCEALACEEIERGEAAFRTLVSVHVGLNSLSLLRYGTGGAEAALVGAAGAGGEVGVFRVDGAGGGFGCGVDADDGAA